MNKRMFIEDFFIALIIGIIALFIDYRISISVVFAYPFSILNYKLIEYRYKHLPEVNVPVFFGAILGIVILTVPILISILFPKYLNWLGSFMGIMIIRTRIIIESFIKK